MNDVNEQIEYRRYLHEKVCKGEKITPQERLWSVTNPVYNQLYGYPYLKEDIIELDSGKLYLIKLEVIKKQYDKLMAIVIGAAGGKGEIITDMQLYDLDDRPVDKKKTKVLLLSVTSNKFEQVVKFSSLLGLLSVAYQCEYYDPLMKVTIRECSDSASARFAMISEKINDNKIQYSCKDPFQDSYEALVFTIEWEEIA